MSDAQRSHLTGQPLLPSCNNNSRLRIVMMSFPPHCSHKSQPLDLSVFGSLKKRTSRAQQNWLRNHPGASMTIYDIPDIAGEAWTDSVTPRNVTAGFVKAVVFPFNRDLFTDLDFAPSSVTDRPLTLARSTAESPLLPAAVELPRALILATPATVALPPMPDTTALLSPTPDTAAIPPTQASALGRDGVQEHVTHIRVTDKTDSHPTAEPAHVSSHILEGTADQSIRNEMLTEADLPGKIVDVRGDGHCIIHAAILCLQSAGYSITHVDLCSALVSEVITNLAFYDNFSTDDEDVNGIRRLIFDKEYNTDTCDLLVVALSNATGAKITIYQYREDAQRYAPIVLKPGRWGVLPKYDITMIRIGDGFGADYSALLSFEENPVATSPLLLSRLR